MIYEASVKHQNSFVHNKQYKERSDPPLILFDIQIFLLEILINKFN